MAEEEAQEETQEEGKKKRPMLLIIIVAVVCIGVSIGAAIFLMGGSEGEATEEVVESEQGAEETQEGAVASKEAFYFSLDPAFVVNFQGKSRARFLQVTIDGVTREEIIKQEVTKHLPQIRNNIVLLLSSKTYDDLITPAGKEKAREEVLSEIQKIMEAETGNPGVENIFFTSFVMQ